MMHTNLPNGMNYYHMLSFVIRMKDYILSLIALEVQADSNEDRKGYVRLFS